MESPNDTKTDTPGRLVTVNQVVAWNIAWLRREARMKQRELADLLGWPENKVSEAETSWNGKRTRQFDAQELVTFSLVFGVPLSALFLPPLDDGHDFLYLIRPEGQDADLGMTDLLAAVLYGDPDDDSDPMESYRQRLLGAVGRYHGDEYRRIVAGWVRGAEGPEALKECAVRMRGDRARLLAEADGLGAWADAFEKAAGEEGAT